MSHSSDPRDASAQKVEQAQDEKSQANVLAVRAAITRTTAKWPVPRTEENGETPTFDVYGTLVWMLCYLNEVLIFPIFGVRLPQVVFTLARTRRFVAAFLVRPWGQKHEDGTYAHEILFNAYYFRSTQAVLEAMAHEMIHLGQEVYKEENKEIFGEPGAGGYHTSDFAESSLKIGLRPVNVANPNLMTGRRVSQIVLDGGPFQIVSEHYLKMGGAMLWTPVEENEIAANGGVMTAEQIAAHKARAEAKRKSKTKFSCPKCPLTARANWKARFLCEACMTRMEPDKDDDVSNAASVAK